MCVRPYRNRNPELVHGVAVSRRNITGRTCCLCSSDKGTELKTTQLGQGHIRFLGPSRVTVLGRHGRPLLMGALLLRVRGDPWGPMESRENVGGGEVERLERPTQGEAGGLRASG